MIVHFKGYLIFVIFQHPDIITQGCCISVFFITEAVCMSMVSCLKCIVSQSTVCLVLGVFMSCHHGLVNEA